MKTNLLQAIYAVAILFLSIAVNAQSPIITHSNQMHSIGEATVYVNANIPFGFDINVPGGANIDWNFFNLTPTGNMTFTYEDPSITTGAANFPGAEEAMGNSAAAVGHRPCCDASSFGSEYAGRGMPGTCAVWRCSADKSINPSRIAPPVRL